MSNGEFVYQGPTGEAIQKYMLNIGMECPQHSNVTDHCLRKLFIQNKDNLTKDEQDTFNAFKDGYSQLNIY